MIGNIISFFSLGVALSRGHGKFLFRGNVTVEEGKKFTLSHIHTFTVLVLFFPPPELRQ